MEPTRHSPPAADTSPVVLTGCGVLRAEMLHLIDKHQWRVEPHLLDSALHVSPRRLERALRGVLAHHAGRRVAVFYGCCHPQMHRILAGAGVLRTQGQNCVEMLLGEPVFTDHLSAGAFFLLEDWARRWDHVTGLVFHQHRHVMREIFREAHRYLLALRTPCSGDFTAEAESVRDQVDLPLRWLDVSLDELERRLTALLDPSRQTHG